MNKQWIYFPLYFKNIKFINGILSRYFYKVEKNKIAHLKLSTKVYRKTSSYVQIDKIMLYQDFIRSRATKKEFQTHQDAKTIGTFSQALVNFHCNIVGKKGLFINQCMC